jgi:hypothetical protein
MGNKGILAAALLAAAALGCGDGGGGATGETAGRYVLGSVVIDADGNRTTYVQTISSLDDGPFTNARAIELPGNGVVMAGERDFFVGLTESPEWVRYSVDEAGGIAETGRLNLLETGEMSIDYGNVIVDAHTALSVFSKPGVAIVWNPSTMKKKGQIDLSSLERDGYELEVWTTTAHDGLVYVPGRWANWDAGKIYPGVSLTIIDPARMQVLGTAADDRCASGGRPVFDAAGYAYVMGDGRNYSIQMFANAAGTQAPDNCLLRVAPGATTFDEGYFYKIPALTGGRQSISELDTGADGSGVAFAKMFYPDQLPADIKPVDFAFWDYPAHKLWRIELADPPTAREVDGLPFAAIGFGGASMDGKLYSGESPDGSKSDVYETDPATNTGKLRFTMDGYFYGLCRLGR